MKPSTLEQRNPKPFWKEPSLKHVWSCISNSVNALIIGSYYIIGILSYIIFCIFIANYFNSSSLLFAFGFGLGGVFVWFIRDFCEYFDETQELKIEVNDSLDLELLEFESALTEVENLK